MKLREDEVRIPSPDGEIRAVVDPPGRRRPAARRAALHRHLPAHRVDAADRAAAGVVRVRRRACRRSTRTASWPAWRSSSTTRARRPARPGRPPPRPRSSTPTGSPCWTPRCSSARPRRALRRRLLHRWSPGLPSGIRPAGRGDRLLLPDRAAQRRAGRRRRRGLAGAGGRHRRPADDRVRVAGPARAGRRAAAGPVPACTRPG